MPSNMVGEAIAADQLFDAVNFILSLQVYTTSNYRSKHYLIGMVILQRMLILLLGIGSIDGQSKERRVFDNDTNEWHIPFQKKQQQQ